MLREVFRTDPAEPRTTMPDPDSWQVVEVSGELDCAQAGSLRRAIDRKLSEQNTPRLALDLGNVTFCDSYGLSVLVYAAKKVRERGGVVVLASTSRQVRSLVQRCGLESILPLWP